MISVDGVTGQGLGGVIAVGRGISIDLLLGLAAASNWDLINSLVGIVVGEIILVLADGIGIESLRTGTLGFGGTSTIGLSSNKLRGSSVGLIVTTDGLITCCITGNTLTGSMEYDLDSSLGSEIDCNIFSGEGNGQTGPSHSGVSKIPLIAASVS